MNATIAALGDGVIAGHDFLPGERRKPKRYPNRPMTPRGKLRVQGEVGCK